MPHPGTDVLVAAGELVAAAVLATVSVLAVVGMPAAAQIQDAAGVRDAPPVTLAAGGSACRWGTRWSLDAPALQQTATDGACSSGSSLQSEYPGWESRLEGCST